MASSLPKQLDAANAILPGRVNLYQLSPELGSALTRAVELARTEKAVGQLQQVVRVRWGHRWHER